MSAPRPVPIPHDHMWPPACYAREQADEAHEDLLPEVLDSLFLPLGVTAEPMPFPSRGLSVPKGGSKTTQPNSICTSMANRRAQP